MDLYGLPPEEFTAARDDAAKADRSLKALRRPTVSAWVLNTLVRHDAGLLDELASLGSSLAQAQQQGLGAELRTLTTQRHALVAGLTERAVGLVERSVSDAVRAEVAATLEAVLADPASAEAVRSGQLVRPLAFAGFGGVDLEGAVAPLPRVSAAPPTASTAQQPLTAGKDTSAAEAIAHAASGALDDAVERARAAGRALADSESVVAAAAKTEAEAVGDVEAARAALAAAEAAQKRAHRDRITAAKDRDALARRFATGTKAVATAQEAADDARAALDALRRRTTP